MSSPQPTAIIPAVPQNYGWAMYTANQPYTASTFTPERSQRDVVFPANFGHYSLRPKTSNSNVPQANYPSVGN
jgi:hypothetical protein